MVITRSQSKRKVQDEQNDKSYAITGTSPLQQDADKDTPRVKRPKKENNTACPAASAISLPLEIWMAIFSFLPPSQLCITASVCRELNTVIKALFVWEAICKKAKLGTPKRKHPTFFALAQANCNRICEICYSLGKSSGSGSVLGVDVNPNETLRLCLKCRRKHFARHAEPTLPTVEQSYGSNNHDEETSSQAELTSRRGRRITKTRALNEYRLLPSNLVHLACSTRPNPYYRNGEPMQLYELNDVIALARTVHGGQIGVDAAISATKKRSAKMREAKVLKNEQRRQQVNAAFEEAGLDQSLVAAAIERFVFRARYSESVETLVARAREILDMERRRLERDQELGAVLAAEGLNRNLAIYDVNSYVKYNQGTPATVVAAIRAVVAENAIREARRLEVEEHLKMAGLELRKDSNWGSLYINNGTGTIYQVVEAARQGDWLARFTYLSSTPAHWRSYHNGNNERPRQQIYDHYSEAEALSNWVRDRFGMGNFKPCSEDMDTEERPPPSLWKRIGHTTVKQITFTCRQAFAEAVNRHPDTTVLATRIQQFSLPSERVAQILDNVGNDIHWNQDTSNPVGTNDSENNKNTYRSLPPNIRLSDVLRREDGEDWASHFLQATKESIFQVAMDQLASDIRANQPEAMKEFIDHQVQHSMRSSRYDWRRSVRLFSEQWAPSVAATFGVHEEHARKFMTRFNDRHYLLQFKM